MGGPYTDLAFPQTRFPCYLRNVAPSEKNPAQPGSPSVLLEGVRRRDPASLDAFFEQHFERVYSLVARLLGNRAAAEDAAQEVFLKIHRAAHTIDPARDPGPWVATIAANVCRDIWRSSPYRMGRKSDSIDDTPGLADRLKSGAANPEEDALAAERARLVREAVMELKDDYREVVVLRDYDGRSYEEIAAMAGANETAVRKRYSRALAELGRLLRKKGL
ncbi:MAG TPA: RNA polymerase sigma factor [Candidatus Eisenbacteria bacterium]|nr:RNA polymerase sigma factor [Candidatus Eisenbacteria bacterium]